MPEFIPWTEIQLFHNVRKYCENYPEILNGNPCVKYKCKVKLHGTNAAIQVTPSSLIAQSRTQIISSSNDNAGFARWVESLDFDDWKKCLGFIIFGEWCGKGIQSNVAIAEINSKEFVVFAARSLADPEVLIVEPQQLTKLVPGNIKVLPWFDTIEIDFSQSSEQIQSSLDQINQWVAQIEQCDPWVKDNFNIEGTGEGLVFYPCSEHHLGTTNFNNLCFKAKGDKHSTIKAKAPAQLDSQMVSNIQDFTLLVLNEPRFLQGVTEVSSSGSLDQKLIGKFIAWICADVQKECQDELNASNLTWKQVQKSISDAARSWYLGKLNG